MSAEVQLATIDTSETLILNERLETSHRNILFLQEEHAITIKALHEEVEKLHDYIRNFHFQKDVLQVVIPNDDFFSCDVATLKSKVDKLLTENHDLKRRLQESNKALQLLDQKQKLEKWQYHQELLEKDKTIQCLQKELEAKCSSVAELTSQISNKKKNQFLKLFSFHSEIPSSFHNKHKLSSFKCMDVNVQTSSKSLPTDDSLSFNCDYSSFSSLSDKSTSDDDAYRVPMLRKQYSFPSPKYGYRRKWSRSSQGFLKLPPLPNRDLVRHQLRVDNLTEKPDVDSLAID